MYLSSSCQISIIKLRTFEQNYPSSSHVPIVGSYPYRMACCRTEMESWTWFQFERLLWYQMTGGEIKAAISVVDSLPRRNEAK